MLTIQGRFFCYVTDEHHLGAGLYSWVGCERARNMSALITGTYYNAYIWHVDKE